MVKHVILWKLKDQYSAEEKEGIKKNIKTALEGLLGKIPGLKAINVFVDGLPSSNADLMLDSVFVDFEYLKGYSIHPDHVAAANAFVRPFTEIRSCFDFEI